MKCPFCETDQPELVSQFGSQLLLSQYRCRACRSYFEGLREDLRDLHLSPWQRSREVLGTSSSLESPREGLGARGQPRTRPDARE
jgi:hypothetical protein